MEDKVIIALVLSFVAGLATSIGAILTFIIKKDDYKIFAIGMSFSAGVMLYLSFMDILPMSIEGMVGDLVGADGKFMHFLAILFFFIGVIASAIIDFLIPTHVHTGHSHLDKEESSSDKFYERSHSHTFSSINKRGRLGAKRVALFTALALSIHNFPEGLSVFVTSIEDVTIGLGVAIAIMLHNIPEGMSVALPVYFDSGSKMKAFWWATLSGLAEPLGALVAYLFLSSYLTPEVVSAILASTAGIMVYISLDELLPTARDVGEPHYSIIGVFSGMAMMAVFSVVI